MKKITLILSLAFIIIASCMIYLWRGGVSVRTEPLVKPSPIDSELNNISFAIVHRLFAELQTHDVIVWGLDVKNPEHLQVFEKAKSEFEVLFKKSVSVASGLDQQQLMSCQNPCWVLSDAQAAPAITQMFLDQMKVSYNFTLIDFKWSTLVPEECEKAKLLKLNCIGPVAIRDVQRKIKKFDQRYFFVRRYLEKDYYLFIQEPMSN